MTSKNPVLEMRGITKVFTGREALKEIDLVLYPGEVHCLLGDNGAGKSTLIKVLSGVHQPTSGEVILEGRRVRFLDPKDAQERGIATVHQDVGLVPLMSVTRNFFLGREPRKRPALGALSRIDFASANEIALREIRGLGITRVREGSQLVGTLSGGERQSIAICRALHFGAKVLVLDEPTSALGVREAAMVLRSAAQARAAGVAVVFITHNAQHAMSIGDRFTVLIQGQVASSFAKGEKSKKDLLDLMAGGDELEELAQELEQLGVGEGGI
jgi:simple sugar transport system ATP-binding protein